MRCLELSCHFFLQSDQLGQILPKFLSLIKKRNRSKLNSPSLVRNVQMYAQCFRQTDNMGMICYKYHRIIWEMRIRRYKLQILIANSKKINSFISCLNAWLTNGLVVALHVFVDHVKENIIYPSLLLDWHGDERDRKAGPFSGQKCTFTLVWVAPPRHVHIN